MNIRPGTQSIVLRNVWISGLWHKELYLLTEVPSAQPVRATKKSICLTKFAAYIFNLQRIVRENLNKVVKSRCEQEKKLQKSSRSSFLAAPVICQLGTLLMKCPREETQIFTSEKLLLSYFTSENLFLEDIVECTGYVCVYFYHTLLKDGLYRLLYSYSIINHMILTAPLVIYIINFIDTFHAWRGNIFTCEFSFNFNPHFCHGKDVHSFSLFRQD